jgi:hypothetical protein
LDISYGTKRLLAAMQRRGNGEKSEVWCRRTAEGNPRHYASWFGFAFGTNCPVAGLWNLFCDILSPPWPDKRIFCWRGDNKYPFCHWERQQLRWKNPD